MIWSVLDVLGDLLPYAIGVALSPLPLIAVFLVFRCPTPRPASAAFLAGRVITVFVVAAAATYVAEALPETGGGSTVAAVLRILLGLALIVWGLTKIRGWLRSRRADPELPGWMASIESATPGRAARLAVIISVANLKEVAFGVGAGLTIGAGHLGPAASAVAVLAYTVTACGVMIIVVLTYVLAADRVGPALDRARDWLVANNKMIIAIVLLVIGGILVGEGMRALP